MNSQAKSDGSLGHIDLIARLRDNPIENEEAHAAAAALEAQARRIAELEQIVAELKKKLYGATPWDGKND